MSTPKPGSDPSKSHTTKLLNVSPEDQEELNKLDAIFDRIKHSRTPSTPYVLATPSLHPYQYRSPHDARSWMIGRLFEPNEDHLQYRTFLYREPYRDCFTLQQGEEDEVSQEQPKSQASNNSSQVPKKKMTLSAYKSKQANGVITPGSKKPSPNLPPTKLKQVQTNGATESAEKPEPAPQKLEPRSPKRPAPEPLAENPAAKRPREDPRLAEQPQKSDSTEAKKMVDRSEPSNSTPHGLPPLMSPVPQSLGNPYDLPPILSPTLPSTIQAELDRLETQRRRAESDASTSSTDRKPQRLPVPDIPAQKQDDGAKSGSRLRSVSVNGKSPNSVTPLRTGTPATGLLVKLKYGKKHATTVSKLLRLPPSRKTAISMDRKDQPATPKQRPVAGFKASETPPKKDIPKITSRPPDTSTSKAKANLGAPKLAEKRPRTDEDASLEVPAKRPRAHSNLERPTTPAEQTVSSPAFSNKSSAQKTQGPYSTPRKDLKAISMIRSSSAEGYDSTPGRSGATPAGSKHLDVKAPTSAPLGSKRQAESQALSQLSQKLNAMGRSLKHESQKILDKDKQGNKNDSKRAAVTSVECILSYMVAYHLQDQSSTIRKRPCDVEATWKTLFPLCMSYLERTKDFPALDGLHRYLGAVICAAICTHVAQRARATVKAHDSPHDPAQADPKPLNAGLMAQHFLSLQKLQHDARAVLPVEDLQKIYPKTWAGQERNAKLGREAERVSANNLSGPYFLPIQSDTTPIQAVRFGLKFLAEFCEKERLDYSLHINLEKLE
ncbi:hypothetical protein EJ04DRAFT_142601 [Polyplosphaeria fusca]|uniref:Ell binding protein Ebp1 C-terminal domain-containing protein n=1 Tax=Polyplosphaeria fusca TaxID=682080 RepID=A0A9P4V4W8_9PLEO|nr:hypothetical protein EJ04DRAFT_142601 [Polyplosphaeria fusca]